jgi:hypothetical protein
MNPRQYLWCLPGFILAGVVYAWITQPYKGPPSVSSVAVRSLILAFWLFFFWVLRKSRFGHWSWGKFLAGCICGGGWLIATFPVGGTFEKSLVNVSTALVFGLISGLFASVSTTTVRALSTGLCVFAGQLTVDFFSLALGWTKFSFGM